MNPIKVTPVGQTSEKETMDFEEHIVGNSSAPESTITERAYCSNVVNLVNHGVLLDS